MRTIRALATAVALVATLPAISAAQEGRQFKDAWFWGIKTGGMTFADSGGSYSGAPTLGIEWFITRTHGGLYVSASHSFINAHALIPRDPAAADSGVRAVDLDGLRRLDVALLAFPAPSLKIHPYFGLGFELSQIASANAVGPFSNQSQIGFAKAVIQNEKVGFSPLLMGGVQYRKKRASVFGQVSASPAQSNFLLYNGRPFTFAFEIGARYNAGASIERN
jgi:hypothetical protein